MLDTFSLPHKLLIKITKLFVSGACLFICNITLAQYNKLDLSFEKFNLNNTRWNSPPFSHIQYTYIDTIDVIDGKQSLVILDKTTVLKEPFPNFVASLFQYLVLPSETNTIELSIFSKSKYVDNVWIKLYGLNNSGKLISRDSVSLISASGWSNFHLNIPKTCASQLYLELYFHTKHTGSNKEKIFPYLKVDNIQIKINGKDISSYREPDLKPGVNDSIQICNHIKLDMDRLPNIDSITDFKKHRILAFGETVHTSLEIQRFVFSTTKVLVEKNNCRLFMMEIPFEIGLRLNDYVWGKINENIEELLFFTLFNSQELIAFLNWLREYNITTKSKISIAGINTSHFLFELDYHLYRVIEDHVPHSQLFVSFAELLKKQKYKDAFTMINDSCAYLNIELGDKQFSEIKHALELRNELLNPNHAMSDLYRDYIMYQNARWAINHYLKNDEQAVIYTHLGHVNKFNTVLGRYDLTSMGNYMHKNYGNDYFVTAVTVGPGTIADPANMKSDSGQLLQKNMHGSLEELCMFSSDPLFYKNLKDVGTTYFIRFVGNQISNSEFFPFNHVGRVDGVVFIRESTHFRHSDEWPKDMKDYFRLMFKKKAQKEKVMVPVK